MRLRAGPVGAGEAGGRGERGGPATECGRGEHRRARRRAGWGKRRPAAGTGRQGGPTAPDAAGRAVGG